jgi:hypothetical protein
VVGEVGDLEPLHRADEVREQDSDVPALSLGEAQGEPVARPVLGPGQQVVGDGVGLGHHEHGEDAAALGHPQVGVGQAAGAAVGLGHQPLKLLVPDRQDAARLARQ